MYDEITTLGPQRVIIPGRKRIRLEGRNDDGVNDAGGGRTNVTKVYCTSFDSRIGRIYVASTENGIAKISVPRETRRDFIDWLKQHFNVDDIVDNRSQNKDVIDQLTRYFNGKLAQFTCPVDLFGTPFQIRVWKELLKVSYGSTITYKALARRVAAPKATQAVGRANSANPLPIIVPCHRVLGSNGALVGYSCGVKTKEFLLRLEGAIML